MYFHTGAVLPLILLLALTSACGGCLSDADPWSFVEVSIEDDVSEAEQFEADQPVEPDRSVCDANREYIAQLGIVDEATLNRRPAGEVVELWVDFGADGVLEGCSITLYDDSGNRVVRLVDHDQAPGPQRLYWMMDYDERAGQPRRTLGDNDGDGIWDYEAEAEFDESGNYLWSTNDEGVDGQIDTRGRFYYDDRGHRTRQEHDHGDDGVIDGFGEFVTDADGRILQWDQDHDADGRWDAQLTWSYGVRENTYAEIEYDHDANTSTSLFTLMELDAQGRVVLTEADYGRDDVIDYAITVEWTGDTAVTRHDFDANGTTDNIEVHDWHRVGDELRHGTIRDDYEADGDLDQIRVHRYDDEGRLLHFEYLDPVTGRPAFRHSYVRGE